MFTALLLVALIHEKLGHGYKGNVMKHTDINDNSDTREVWVKGQIVANSLGYGKVVQIKIPSGCHNEDQYLYISVDNLSLRSYLI